MIMIRKPIISKIAVLLSWLLKSQSKYQEIVETEADCNWYGKTKKKKLQTILKMSTEL